MAAYRITTVFAFSNTLLLDFWRWSSSDLTNNAARGLIAEWLVGHALGLVSEAREEWAPVDFVMHDEQQTKIEVKSSSPWQTWGQDARSNNVFQIGPTVGQELDAKARRQSDLYVFCVLDCPEKTRLDPMNTDQWRFFIIPTAALNEQLKDTQSQSSKDLEQLAVRLVQLGATETRYEDLEATINRMKPE